MAPSGPSQQARMFTPIISNQASIAVEQQFISQFQYSSDLDIMSIARLVPAPAPEPFRLPDVERLRFHYREDVAFHSFRGFPTYIASGQRHLTEEGAEAWSAHWRRVLSDPSRRPQIDPGAREPVFCNDSPDTQSSGDQPSKGSLSFEARRELLDLELGWDASTAPRLQLAAVPAAAPARSPAAVGVSSVHGDLADQDEDVPSSTEDDAASTYSRGSSCGAVLDDDGCDEYGREIQCIIHKPSEDSEKPKAPKQSKFMRFAAKVGKSWGSAAHKVEKPVGRVLDKVGSTFEGWWQSALDKVRSW